MAQKTHPENEVIQGPKPGETIVVYAEPDDEILLSADFTQADVQFDEGRVVFEFANDGKVVLEFVDPGDIHMPNIVMPDGNLLSLQSYLASLAVADVEPAFGFDLTAQSSGIGEYGDDAGALLGGLDMLDGLEQGALAPLAADVPDFAYGTADLDDGPTANPDKVVIGAVEDASVNLVLILDQSGSMAGSRLTLMKEAVENLIDTFGDDLQSVMVSSFSSGATVYKVDGSAWLDPLDAVSQVNALYASGGTNYDTAIFRVMEEWSAPPDAVKTYVYFLSDGYPGGTIDGTDTSGERGAWVDFLEQSGIDEVYSVGIGSGVSAAPLLTVAWSPDGQHADNVFPVTVETDLSAILVEISQQTTGNVLANDLPGEDGLGDPAMVSVSYDGTKYTFDHDGDPDAYTIDLGAEKGTFYIESDGDYVYSPPSGGVSGNPWVISYTMQDGDGSTSSSTITGPDAAVEDTALEAMLQLSAQYV
jgi:hypothetical protein